MIGRPVGGQKTNVGKAALIGGDNGLHPENGSDRRRSQNILRRTDRNQFAPVQDGDAVAEHGGMVEIVQRRHDRQALPAHQIEQADLVADVEMVGRLVQKQDMWLLRQRAGDVQPLPFAAGKVMPASIRLVRHVDIFKRRIDDGVIL